jgi:lipopolysaccharide heptosyltransferase II
LRLAHSHENPYQLLTNWVPDPEPASGVRHEARRQLDLVAAVGCSTDDERLSLHIDPTALARVRRRLEDLGLIADAPWVVVHPGASAPSRRYPARHFAAVVRTFVAELGWQVVLTGGATEISLVEEVRAAAGVSAISVAGQLDLEELGALLTMAPLLVSNNTGPVHVAAAVGTPVVDLYALTNPQHTPWLVPNRVLFHDVPCRDCYKSICPAEHHACLELVPPSAVIQAARELIRQTRQSWRCNADSSEWSVEIG